MTDVLVLVEGQGSVPTQNTLELLGAARRLADATQGRVKAAVLDAAATPLTAGLFAYGTEQVLRAEHPLLTGYQGDAYVAALTQIAGQAEAQVILLADDS
ncbi:MAG: electron transfer flavoprotein subunit alpha/FixB family protein, partial [candidate division NC10 bacterium]|nr:electron transfer flavoprotein subunit alpha/FixB family protein [candidate division NC10 bacterium]